MLEFYLIMYFLVGFVINSMYVYMHPKEYKNLTDGEKVITFTASWVFWVLVYTYWLLKEYINYLIKK